MHTLARFILATAILALPQGIAVAQQPTAAQSSAIKSACRADYQSHCASVPPGGAASLQCLQQNMADLSASCQQAVGAIGGAGAPAAGAPAAGAPAGAAPAPAAPPPQLSPREELAILRADCSHDYRRYCGDVRPGGGRAIACLRDHVSHLSRQCRSALQSVHELP